MERPRNAAPLPGDARRHPRVAGASGPALEGVYLRRAAGNVLLLPLAAVDVAARPASLGADCGSKDDSGEHRLSEVSDRSLMVAALLVQRVAKNRDRQGA